MSDRPTPPRALRLLLERALPEDAREGVSGDLEELFAARAASRGRARATLWYAREVATCSARFLWERLREGPLRRPPTFGASWLDFKLGLRMAGRYPGLSLIASGAMAVAIAVGAGWFEFTNEFMHPALPLDEGDRVVGVRHVVPDDESSGPGSLHDFVAWRSELTAVADLAAFRGYDRNLVTEDGRAEPVHVAEVTASAFRVARVPPLLGRPLVDDDEREGAPPVVVIGAAVWRARFGADPAALGRIVRVGATEATLVGVMPDGYAFPVNYEAWVPLKAEVDARAGDRARPVNLVGRLASGRSLDEAKAELATLSARRPASDGVRVNLERFPASIADLEFRLGYAANAVFIVFLVVICVQVATLMFARTESRASEIAVRSALGAGRGRILFQLFVESLVLAGIGAALGLGALGWGMGPVMDAFWAAQGDPVLPFWVNDRLSLRTIVYACGLALLGAVVTGVIPALRVTGPRVQDRMRRGGGGGARTGRLWTAVIVGQVALTVAFLPMAVSEAITAVRKSVIVPPLPADQLLIADFELDTPLPDAERAERLSALRLELARRLEAEGAGPVAFASRLPPWGHPRGLARVDGAADSARDARFARVEPGFFEALGVRPLSGRDLSGAADAAAGGVAVIDQTLARRLFGGGAAVGRSIHFAERADDPGRMIEVVGVVPDLDLPRDVPLPGVLYLGMPPGAVVDAAMAFRPGGAAGDRIDRLRAAAAAVSPDLRLTYVRTLAEVWEVDRVTQTMESLVLVVVAALALLLATVGLYSIMAFTVARRTREIGIRAALGAHPRLILRAILSRSAFQLGLGVLLGGVGVPLLIGLTEGTLEELWIYAAVSTAMLAAGLLAAVAPARRGLRIQPTEAFREG